jgi:hypothetical protein
MTDNDSRTRERVPFEIAAVFTHHEQTYTCTCENISMGGVLLESEELFPVGLSGFVEIILRSGFEQLEVKGLCHIVRVVTSLDSLNQIGLEFDDLDSESSIVLFNMIRYQKV